MIKSAKTNPKNAVHKRNINGVSEETLQRRKYIREYMRERRNNHPGYEIPAYFRMQLHENVRGAARLKMKFPTVKQLLKEAACEALPNVQHEKPSTPRPQPGAGLPADIMPRGKRCCAWRASLGKWCGKLAMVGSDYCEKHNGNLERAQNQVGRLDRMPSIYSETLKGTLADAVNRMVSESKEQQFNFREELALVKHTAVSQVAMYNAAVESGKPEAMASAGMMLREALKEVAEFGDRVAKIEATGNDTITVHDMHFLLNQAIAIIYKVIGGTPQGQQQAAEIEAEFRKSVLMPMSGETVDATARVTQTSNEAFAGMLQSVPTEAGTETPNA